MAQSADRDILDRIQGVKDKVRAAERRLGERIQASERHLVKLMADGVKWIVGAAVTVAGLLLAGIEYL